MLQTTLFVVFSMVGGVFSDLDVRTLDIFSQRVSTRKVVLENEMNHKWSRLSEVQENANKVVENCLKQSKKDIDEIKTDSDISKKITENMAPELISLMRRNGTTGAFVVLTAEGAKNEDNQYPGVYFKDVDPTNYNADKTDINLLRGNESISNEIGISIDQHWKTNFSLSGDGNNSNEAFYYNPIIYAQQSPESTPEKLGYWSPAFCLETNGNSVITYSIPLIYSDGTVYGVIGVEVAVDYLQSLLPYEEICQQGEGSYYIGITEDDGQSFYTICSSGSSFGLYFGQLQPIYVKEYITDDIVKMSNTYKPAETVYGSIQPFSLYSSDSAFSNTKWVLVGLENKNIMYEFNYKFETILFISFVVSLIIGLVSVFVFSGRIIKPVATVGKELKKVDPNSKIKLSRFNIKEIDDIASAIEKLGADVAEASSRMTKIINLTNIPVGVFECHLKAGTVYCSQSLFKVMGWKMKDQEKPYIKLDHFTRYMDLLKRYIDDKEKLIFKLPPQLGEKPVWIQLTYTIDEDIVLGAVVDITKDVEQKQKIKFERDYDTLTGLYNRRAFKYNVEKLFNEQPKQLKTAAVVMFDLDNLKYLNDTYGHDCGDQYIKGFAGCISQMDKYHSIVARRSGDEFYALLYGYNAKDQIREEIQRIWLISRNTTIELPNKEIYRMRASGGIAWYPDDSVDPKELEHFADFAMYNVKHTVKGNIQEFNKENYTQNSILFNGQAALNNLIDNRRIEYAFQPIVSAKDGSLYGYEMLMRPQMEQLKSPVEVLRLAKTQSKLYQIEKLTWYKALETFAKYVKSGKIGKTTKAFINSIGGQAMNNEDADTLEKMYGNITNQIALEVTESEPNEEDVTKRKITRIKKWGGIVAIDDFGTGYNSEASLMYLSPDLVKADRSFIKNIDKDSNKRGLLKNLISYAKKRNITVLAEGVETKEEMQMVISLGVDYLQGYYIAKPSIELPTVSQSITDQIKYAWESSQNNKQ